jgi:ribosome biogenesis GTPase
MAAAGDKDKRKVRVDFRRNRSRPARVKDWKRQTDHGAEEAEHAQVESVAAKGDLSRRRTVTEAADSDQPDAGTEGTVIAVRGLIADVHDGQRVWPCTVRRVLRTRRIDRTNAIAVGDNVRFTVASEKDGVVDEGVVEWVAPRHGELKRRVGRNEQTLVANVDQVLIVSSADMPPPKPHLIDRYIVATLAGDMQPIVCMNKTDLEDAGEGCAALAGYESLGYTTLATSAVDGTGIDRLRDLLKGRKSVLAGQSGVGKSSLLNAMQPGLQLRVGDIIEQLQKGRHTTTTAELLTLDAGGYVVDTPGIRAFDIAGVPLAELEMHFVEFADLIPECKFPDCTHIHEPDCAVRAAVEVDQVSLTRYESYARMFQERAGTTGDA